MEKSSDEYRKAVEENLAELEELPVKGPDVRKVIENLRKELDEFSKNQ